MRRENHLRNCPVNGLIPCLAWGKEDFGYSALAQFVAALAIRRSGSSAVVVLTHVASLGAIWRASSYSAIGFGPPWLPVVATQLIDGRSFHLLASSDVGHVSACHPENQRRQPALHISALTEEQ